jgi:toxin CcdB
MMAQFDVYANPLAHARLYYPYVVAMQSDFPNTASDQIVAPLAPKASMVKVAGRLTPLVAINGVDHVVLVPRLTPIRSNDLARSLCSIATARGDLLAAIDYLFFGV